MALLRRVPRVDGCNLNTTFFGFVTDLTATLGEDGGSCASHVQAIVHVLTNVGQVLKYDNTAVYTRPATCSTTSRLPVWSMPSICRHIPSS
ncbi:MAG: hypothetical protein J07HQX50_00754 [Haloquadratum sp. J07HQX50]|nr:MAG: hypothetical protein J07HQX50_00754 [Haloquadratum sp. J07HQX50]